MFRIFVIAACLMACSLYCSTTRELENSSIKQTEKAPNAIRVLLARDVEGALLEVKGNYKIFDPNTGKRLASRLFGKIFRIHAVEDGIQWGEIFPDIYQIQLVPDNSKTTVLVDGIQYKGKITVYNVKGRMYIINEVDVEDYIKSILAVASLPHLEPEVARALAIAARTQAMYLMSKAQQAHWHVEAEKVSYQGYGITYQSPEIEEAIKDTHYLALNFSPEGFLVCAPTLWHNHCAGYTATYSSVFRHPFPYNYDKSLFSHLAFEDRENTSWIFNLSPSKLTELTGFEYIEEVKPFKDSTSGKVYALRFCSGMRHIEFDFLELQNKLGNKLLSNDFSVSISKQGLNIQGYGSGHSVGMCLFTANDLAKKGKNGAEILNYFFPKGQIISLSTQ